jgi:hypothetical protein
VTLAIGTHPSKTATTRARRARACGTVLPALEKSRWTCDTLPPSAPSTLQTDTPQVAPSPVPSPQPAPRTIVPGDYQVTFSAQDCEYWGSATLPAELRTLRVSSRVQQDGGDVRVLVKTKSADSSLWGRVDHLGNVALTNFRGNEQWDPLWESLPPPHTFISILVDEMKVTLSPEGLLSEGTFQGFLQSHAGICASGTGTHSVKFVRQGGSTRSAE